MKVHMTHMTVTRCETFSKGAGKAAVDEFRPGVFTANKVRNQVTHNSIGECECHAATVWPSKWSVQGQLD